MVKVTMNRQSDLLLQTRRWTYQRQRLGRAGTNAADILREIVGVYSSHPTAPLALWTRVKAFSPADFRKLEAERRAIRINAMRGSVFFMEGEDAAKAFAARRAETEKAYRQLAASLFAPEEYTRLKALILAAATQPLTPKELRAVTGMTEGEITRVARTAATEGDILRVGADSLRSNSLRYVSTVAWCPGLLDEGDPDDSLRWLAGRYLAAFGPARLQDFQWWAGVSKTRAAAALDTVDTITLEDGSLLLSSDQGAFEQVTPPPPDAIDILPKWDSYTMGYAPDGRARLVAPQMRSRVYTNVGDGLGTVLLAGQSVGAWTNSFSGSRMDVKLDIFDPAAEPHLPTIRAKFDEIAAFLGGKSCAVTLTDYALAPSLGLSRLRKTEAEG